MLARRTVSETNERKRLRPGSFPAAAPRVRSGGEAYASLYRNTTPRYSRRAAWRFCFFFVFAGRRLPSPAVACRRPLLTLTVSVCSRAAQIIVNVLEARDLMGLQFFSVTEFKRNAPSEDVLPSSFVKVGRRATQHTRGGEQERERGMRRERATAL